MPGTVSLLDELKTACAATVAAAGVSIDAAAAASVAETLPPGAAAAAARPTFPVRFDSLEAEVNLLALLRLLDFGSEHDAALRASAGRGARETAQFGALGLFLSDKKLDAKFLREFSAFGVANYFGFEPRVDEQLQPGILISKPGPLQPYADAIRQTLNEAGAALDARGAPTLGAYILSSAAARAAAGEAPRASAFVEDLAAAFEGFRDAPAAAAAAAAGGEGEGGGESNGDGGGAAPPRAISFHRKAQALASDLYERFGAAAAARASSGGGGGGSTGGGGDAAAAEEEGDVPPGAECFSWVDADLLAGDSGAPAAAAWTALGVVKGLPERLAAAVEVAGSGSGDGGGAGAGAAAAALEPGDEALMRAAAVVAADAVAAATAAAPNGKNSAAQLGQWAVSLLDDSGRLQGKARVPVLAPGTRAY